MTRQEFGAILMKAKKEANVKLIESLPYIQRLSPKRIEAIETGKYNYELADAFLYINMCGATLEMLYDFITSIQDLRKALSRELKNFDISVSRLSQLSGVPISVINAFLEGHARLKIDSFLKIANALGEEIVIQ